LVIILQSTFTSSYSEKTEFFGGMLVGKENFQTHSIRPPIPATKARQRYHTHTHTNYRPILLMNNRCKNPKHNPSNLNPTILLKGHIP